jgi:hypothetical protein
MNADRLVIFRTALSDAMSEIRTKEPAFYSWSAGSTPESIAVHLVEAVEKRGSIRGINLTDRCRRRLVAVLGIKNTLASFDAYLKGA